MLTGASAPISLSGLREVKKSPSGSIGFGRRRYKEAMLEHRATDARALDALVGPVLRGDADAVAALVRGVGLRMLRVVRQVLGTRHPEAEDVMQDAVFGLLEALPHFRGQSSVLHFASRVALLTAMNARRRLRLRERHASELPPEGLDGFEAPESCPVSDLHARRRRKAVERLLGELPPAQAEALGMHLILGFTIAETAEACGVPPNTVRSRLLAAKTALRRAVAENEALAGDIETKTKGAS